MTNITCDACGKPAEYAVYLAPQSYPAGDVQQKHDVCRECYDKIRKIITGVEVHDANPI